MIMCDIWLWIVDEFFISVGPKVGIQSCAKPAQTQISLKVFLPFFQVFLNISRHCETILRWLFILTSSCCCFFCYWKHQRNKCQLKLIYILKQYPLISLQVWHFIPCKILYYSLHHLMSIAQCVWHEKYTRSASLFFIKWKSLFYSTPSQVWERVPRVQLVIIRGICIFCNFPSSLKGPLPPR